MPLSGARSVGDQRGGRSGLAPVGVSIGRFFVENLTRASSQVLRQRGSEALSHLPGGNAARLRVRAPSVLCRTTIKWL